jgi:hypothetical protein
MVMDERVYMYALRQRLVDHPEHLYKRVTDEKYGFQSLSLLHITGSKEVAELLLQLGLSVDLTDSMGNTPLHFAAMRGLKEVVLVLLKGGADVNQTNDRGESALDWAATLHIALILQGEGASAGAAFDPHLLDLPLQEVVQKNDSSLKQTLQRLHVDPSRHAAVRQWMHESKN